jgi:hypothetical protein
LSEPAATPNNVAVTYSPALRDILKMLDAKVDPEVVKAYIKNSPIPFNPSATEIIALKQRGVPDELITTMIQHGAEVRSQLAAANQATAPMTPPSGAVPAEDYSATAPSYSYPDYASYPYYGYGYPYAGYPYNYWWYNYSYPFAYYSPFFYGFHGHDGHDHFHNGFHDGHGGFHGGHSVAVHGGAGFGNHAAWAPARGGFGHAAVAGGSFAGRPGGFHTGGFAMHSGGGAMGHGGGFSGGHGGGGGGHR